MPYIKKEYREVIDEALVDSKKHFGSDGKFITPGLLNYIITKILMNTEPENYEDYNKLIGVLECCKLELYRRAVSKHEDKKIEENGDVY